MADAWSSPPDDLHGLHLRHVDVAGVVSALRREARREGLGPVAPEELSPFGRWFMNDEEPGVQRYLVGPEEDGWVSVLPSVVDWEHDLGLRLSEALACTAVHLMLHDGDVFTLHLHERGRLAAAYVSSPVHFDQPAREDGDLGVDLAALLPACRQGTTLRQLAAALSPPGAIDVDGRSALRATGELLGLGRRAELAYPLCLDDDRLNLRPEHGALAHLTFARRESDDELEPRPPGEVLRFPGRR